MMFARLLVPTDFSAPSDAALDYARAIADAFGGHLQLLHVLGNDFLRPVFGDPRAVEIGVLNCLHERLSAGDRQSLCATTTVERSDDPADEIVTQARVTNADLIVMGTHGRSGVGHLLVGSVAEKVVRTAPCPVLTLHAAPPAPHATVKRILVPTDFSAPSDAALACARQTALTFGASVHLVHVLDDSAMSAPFGSDVLPAWSPDPARLKDARERLSHRVTAADGEGPRVTTEIIVGATARTIVGYAADNGFDSIVMGTHGRTGVAHLLMGSIAEKVVRTARCPVMTTHHRRARDKAA